ncbi:entry exclusion lipoprotein TrbK [Acinetobacter higginsii]
MPEVNDENCKRENIAKIKDDFARANFSDKCFSYPKPQHTNRDKGY